MAKNPEILEKAAVAMQTMNPDDLDKAMAKMPLPGVDAQMMKSQMEAIKKNPDMAKSAIESLKSLPEEERMKMFSEAAKSMTSKQDSEAHMPREASEQLSENPMPGIRMFQMMQAVAGRWWPTGRRLLLSAGGCCLLLALASRQKRRLAIR